MKALIAAALSWLLVACSSAAGSFDAKEVGKLQPGVSTIADAIHRLGPPSAETDYAQGSKLLAWQSASGANAAIVFDEDGRMIRVTQLAATAAQTPAPAAPQPAPAAAPHPLLGISASNVSPELAKELKIKEPGGIVVVIVGPGSVAARAGLSKGDVILSFNGARIKDLTAFAQAMNAVSAGQAVTVVVLRGGKEVPLTIAF